MEAFLCLINHHILAKLICMNFGFWSQLNKPILALAPMADVTDNAFRQMFARYGKPDVMFTEFVSTDGLNSPGRKNLSRELQYTENQRPIVAQIWGNKPENFFESAKLIVEMGFDGIDVNFGCPQPKEMKQGTCAALISKPKLALEILDATMLGAGTLPVSVKTRIGVKKIETENWINTLLKANLAAITLHARTAKEMSAVPAHWDEIKKAVQLRDKNGRPTLILGNGDIKNLEQAKLRIKQTGADGVMIGRGAFGTPWFFAPHYMHKQKAGIRRSPELDRHGSNDFSVKRRLEIMAEHAELFEKVFDPPKNFAIMRKHFKAYCSGFAGANTLRANLMKAENAVKVRKIVAEFLSVG